MSTLKERLQERFLIKLDSVSNNTTSFINEVLSSKKYSTQLTSFENEVISIFFDEGSKVCCYSLFYNSEEMLIKRLKN